ncbi:MAG: hypothetical protein JOZ54_17660 [Acidobacteria bacterium]|nr:hypothetical protein [Acidobacteriota bacterium]
MGRPVTVMLDDDAAERLEAARDAGAPVDAILSDAVRRMFPESKPAPSQGYVFPPGPMLHLEPGINVDNIEELLDEIEGPWRR